MTSHSLGTLDYDSDAHGSPMWDELRELVRYRDLLGLLVTKIIYTRYKRSLLGVAWTLLNPLLNMAVMTIAFSALFHSTLKNYPVYVLAGLIVWSFFTQTTVHAMNTLVWGSNLLKRVYLPRTVFSVASIGNGLINLVLSLIPLIVIMLLLGHPFYPVWWIVPLAVLLLAMFALGVALFFSVLAVYFVDVVDMYQVALQAWFFLTPIMYPKTVLSATAQGYLYFNPMYNLLELFRAPLYAGTLPELTSIVLAIVWSVGALLVGWWAFTRKANEFAYRI